MLVFARYSLKVKGRRVKKLENFFCLFEVKLAGRVYDKIEMGLASR